MSLGVCASPVMLLTRLTLSPSSPDYRSDTYRSQPLMGHGAP